MKMTREEWKQLTDRVLLTLRPTQFPVAMKFCETQEEYDSYTTAVRCSVTPATVCKCVGMAAQSPGSYAIDRSHVASIHCCTNNGLREITEEYLSGSRICNPPLAWHLDPADAAKHIAAAVPMLPEKPFAGIVCSNLSTCDIEEPDVIVLHLPSQAAFHLLAGYVAKDYEPLQFNYTGESNCIDTYMMTRKIGKIGLSLGCRGERACAGLGYGEVRLSMTAEQLIRALDGTDELIAGGIDYPYNPTAMLKTSW